MEPGLLENNEMSIRGPQLVDGPSHHGRANAAPHITTLPPELLAEIFLHFLPIYPASPPCAGPLSPLLLCRICRRWRIVALSTPTLWRAISMDFFSKTHDLPIQELELLENWVSRSGKCPLSVSVRIGNLLDPLLMDRLLHAVMAHCRRWEHVTLLIPTSHLHLIQGEMPQLRYLNFGPTNFSRTHNPLMLFDRAPQLRTLALAPNFLTSALHLPWAQITHLESASLYEYECLEILSEATRLICFSVTVCDNPSNVPVVEAAIPVRPHLCDLALRVDDPDYYWRWKILDRLTLPALRTLQISEPFITLGSLNAFISRSQCTLRELRVTHATFPESVFRNVLPTFGAIILENANSDE
ncbi:hypothetical protein B0H16DRAFT_1886058 [Mycena metata]|uniref:F-box domain-containing protein n=1 Tax=Mycena metata TaxID=1033252 RepID=A0AAD7J3E9_9AGAR|nr:hypothetical protein B0H16DRAFT_1886058 [Mycena metata]